MPVGVQSHWFSVGSAVSWGEAGVGVVATENNDMKGAIENIPMNNFGKTLLITPIENLNAPFPTKDRNDSFTLGAYSNNILVGVASFTRDGEERKITTQRDFVYNVCFK